MSILKRTWKRKKASQVPSIFHQKDFLAESDSSIEKAVFWSSNFLSIPFSGRSLLNLKSSQERYVKERLNKMKLTINVGGERFVIPYKIISHYPETLLATQEVERFFDKRKKEYFFDRDPDMFRYVFKFYKNDKIHYPMDECIQALTDEFKFFRIPMEIIKECCYPEFHLEMENNANCIKCVKQERFARHQGNADKLSKDKPVSWKNHVLSFLNKTSGDRGTTAASYALLICVFLNLLGIVLETLPCTSSEEKCGVLYWKMFLGFDSMCVLIFTVEFAVTLAVQKNRKSYFCSIENLVFFISLVPAYLAWILNISLGVHNVPVEVDDALKALRVFRLVKIAKASSHLRETVREIVAAARGLALVLAICIIAIVVLSVLIYHVPNEHSFPHVPMAMWYFVVTMTCLGYGDCVPVTAAGKVLGIVGVLLGILVVSLPVPIIQNKLGASLDDVEPEPDEIVLDNLYPPDFADRQRRLSRMISLEHSIRIQNQMQTDADNI